MSDIAAALMSALGMGPKKPQTPVLSAAEEAAPWNVPQGSVGARPQGGSGQVAPTLPDAAPPSRLDELDALIEQIKKQKQMAAAAGGSPIPQ